MKTQNSVKDQWIVLDIDDTCAPFVEVCYERLNAHYGKSLVMGDHPNYWAMEHFGLDRQQWNEVTQMLGISECLIPHQGLVAALRTLSDRFNIEYVTARGLIKDAEVRTREWLKDHEFPVDSLKIVKPDESKAAVMNPCELFVEDNYFTAWDVALSGKAKRVWLIDYPWNQGQLHACMTRLKPSEFAEHLLNTFQ